LCDELNAIIGTLIKPVITYTKTEEETMLGKKKKLSDDQLEEVNGGQQVIVVKSPKYVPTVLRLIFNVKKNKEQQAPSANKEE
jgi:hypothetical protein